MNDILVSKKDDRLKTYSPIGTKSCKGICDRDVIVSSGGPVVVCNACKRIVIDSRQK